MNDARREVRKLPTDERWMVRRCVRRGQAVDDPSLAPLAARFASDWKRSMRWFHLLAPLRWLALGGCSIALVVSLLSRDWGWALPMAIFVSTFAWQEWWWPRLVERLERAQEVNRALTDRQNEIESSDS